MTLDQLTDHEVLALLCLARKVVVADGVITVAEFADMHALGKEIGADTFARVSEELDGHPTSLAHALLLASRVHRDDARAEILRRLDDLAGADGMDPSEWVVLDSLEELWIV